MRKILFFILLGAVSVSLWTWENQDWITEYNWHFEDGRDFVKQGTEHIYWHSYKTPYGEFRKFTVPAGSIVYRQKLRQEKFFYLHQNPAVKDKIFYLGISTGDNGADDEFDLTLRDNNSYLSVKNGLRLYLSGYRNGEQPDPAHPIAGIWGESPALNELRLVPPDNYVYYLEIDKEIPGWGVRHGTFLFKQTGDKTFESDASFPDGHVRLEIVNEELLLLTPLYTLPDEKVLTAPLVMRRGGKK